MKKKRKLKRFMEQHEMDQYESRRRREKEKGLKSLFKVTMSENLPNLGKKWT